MRCGISALVILRVLNTNMSPFATATAVRSFRRPLTGSPTRAPTSRRSSRKLRSCGGLLPRWIPVEERLPEDRGDVLVVAYWHERWDVYMGWCAPERAAWSVHIGIGDRGDVAVTHWMPLPEPPEVE